MNDGDHPAAPVLLLVRRWQVGSSLVTLRCPRTEPGQEPEACLTWSPRMPDRLTGNESMQLDEGLRAAIRHIERSTGMRPLISGDPR